MKKNMYYSNKEFGLQPGTMVIMSDGKYYDYDVVLMQ